ncbi:MAG: MarR family transcriptional regulator [Lachnospiraceae bacterium]|nr:MarR family transcriptional regulator [Lachnospiraceae bacterium]
MEETLHYLLMANHLMFQKALLTEIKDTGLTSGQPKVLDYLRNHDGAVQKEIAAVCNIEPATLTSVLLGMENKNLIVRKMLDGNRRSLYVYLTKTGKTLAERVADEFAKIETNAFSGFTDQEKEMFIAFLTKVNNNMNREGDVTNDKN